MDNAAGKPHKTQTEIQLSTDRFLQDLLNRPVYSLRFAGPTDRNGAPVDISPAQAKKVQRCLSTSPVFAYAKVSADRIEQARYLEKAGFRIADTLVEFRKPLSAVEDRPAPKKVRTANSNDVANVQRIAGRSFRYSRFHSDPEIPSATANLIKSRWSANYFKGTRGDCMLVSLENGVVTGFTLLIFAGEDLVIDLIAVDPAFRRTGSAGRMLAHACQSFPQFKRIIAGTQLTNAPSIALYAKNDFRMGLATYVFHYHH